MILECSLAIIKKSDKLLYSKRVKNPYQKYYEFPGGKVERNETPEIALYRECFEELGSGVVVKPNRPRRDCAARPTSHDNTLWVPAVEINCLA